jgi:hypothetical protein
VNPFTGKIDLKTVRPSCYLKFNVQYTGRLNEGNTTEFKEQAEDVYFLEQELFFRF